MIDLNDYLDRTKFFDRFKFIKTIPYLEWLYNLNIPNNGKNLTDCKDGINKQLDGIEQLKINYSMLFYIHDNPPTIGSVAIKKVNDTWVVDISSENL